MHIHWKTLAIAALLLFLHPRAGASQEFSQLEKSVLFSNFASPWDQADHGYYHPMEPWTWHVLPEGNLYGTYWASAQEPRLGTQIVSTDESTFQDSSIGGRLGLFKYGPRHAAQGFQLDILGGAKLRQDWQDNSLDVLASDFRYDILGTFADGPHHWKLGFYHVSAHLGDEFLIRNPEFNRKNYFRDAFVLGYSYNATPDLRLYGEVGWGFHTEFSESWEFQIGLDYGPSGPTGYQGAPFFAINSHLREELNFGGNLAFQAGWAWKGDSLSSGVLRTGLYVYEGGTPHLSFFDQHETQIGWGLWYDY